MTSDTYNQIAMLQDQFISMRSNTCGLQIAILADNKETIEQVTQIARKSGNTVKKLVIGKGTLDAEMHLTIK